jgi:hypothetical protein
MHALPHTVSPPTTLEEGYNKVRIPQSQRFGLIRSASTQPRPDLDVHHRLARKKNRRGTGLRVFSPPHPRHHHGVQGWTTILEARRYSHPHRDRQNFTLRHPRRPSLLLPYKRAGQGSTREKEASQRPSASEQRHPTQRSTISSNHPCTLFLPLRLGLGALSHKL